MVRFFKYLMVTFDFIFSRIKLIHKKCFRGQFAEKCIHFRKGCCTNLDCGFVHTYRYCYEYQNTTCSNKKCPYLHCTSVEQHRYLMTGKATENLKREVGRTLQNTDICGDFKNDMCIRRNCDRRHVKLDDRQPLECLICREQITIKSFGAATCGHMFCYNCALKCLNNDVDKGNSIKLQCPMCRSQGGYKNLM